MHLVTGLLAALLALLDAGCADDTPKLGSGQDVVTAASDSVRITLDLPPEIHAGQPVPITIRLANIIDRPLDLYLRGRTIAFDIFVTRPNGEVVWQRLKDEIIPAIVQLKTLQPGEVLELRDVWPQRDERGHAVAPDSYLVRGAILTDGPTPLETAPVSLRVAAG